MQSVQRIFCCSTTIPKTGSQYIDFNAECVGSVSEIPAYTGTP